MLVLVAEDLWEEVEIGFPLTGLLGLGRVQEGRMEFLFFGIADFESVALGAQKRSERDLFLARLLFQRGFELAAT